MAKELGFAYGGINNSSKEQRKIWVKHLDNETQARMVVGSNPTLVNLFVYENPFPDGDKIGELQDASVNRVREFILHWKDYKARYYRQESIDDEIPDLRAYAMKYGETPRILISYTKMLTRDGEEDVDYENGWVDDEGVEMAPDEFDREDGKTAVDLAVAFLWTEGATEHSSSQFDPNGWYDSGWDQNRAGDEIQNSYHLKGFLPEQLEEIYNKLRAKLVALRTRPHQ
jgi:hypothetical protein